MIDTAHASLACALISKASCGPQDKEINRVVQVDGGGGDTAAAHGGSTATESDGDGRLRSVAPVCPQRWRHASTDQGAQQLILHARSGGGGEGTARTPSPCGEKHDGSRQKRPAAQRCENARMPANEGRGLCGL
ncbi:unnamed protein product [Lampetra fluviatilis]